MATETDTDGLELALSGGGVRAMAFHAGVLKLLAEHELLERVRHISSVSGGSLLIGLILQKAGMCWPTSTAYLSRILPAVREQLTTRNLQAAALGRLLLPWNWQYVISRANVLAQAIQASWDMRATLSDLPVSPLWSINGTTAETGRRFRFKSNGCGDYQLGYANASAFPLSQALAMSAAFPGAIGPLAINCSQYEWRKRPYWDAPADAERIVQLAFATRQDRRHNHHRLRCGGTPRIRVQRRNAQPTAHETLVRSGDRAAAISANPQFC
jgi:NTE family protein